MFLTHFIHLEPATRYLERYRRALLTASERILPGGTYWGPLGVLPGGAFLLPASPNNESSQSAYLAGVTLSLAVE